MKRELRAAAILPFLLAGSAGAEERQVKERYVRQCYDAQTKQIVACETPEQRVRLRAMAGALTALATDAAAAARPLASLAVEAPLSTSAAGPHLDVRADLTALPGESIDLADVRSFNALELAIGLVQPLPGPLKFGVYVDGGFASRLATSDEPSSRLPAWWSGGLVFRTADRAHHLRVGMGGDQRLSGEWSPAVHVAGATRIGERAGVSVYVVGSLIRALELPGFRSPPRDSLRIGVALGNS